MVSDCGEGLPIALKQLLDRGISRHIVLQKEERDCRLVYWGFRSWVDLEDVSVIELRNESSE